MRTWVWLEGSRATIEAPEIDAVQQQQVLLSCAAAASGAAAALCQRVLVGASRTHVQELDRMWSG